MWVREVKVEDTAVLLTAHPLPLGSSKSKGLIVFWNTVQPVDICHPPFASGGHFQNEIVY
jgi:hypothetical protein